jgi:hypothetical protein
MTRSQAIEWVYDQDEASDDIDGLKLEEAFAALYGRPSEFGDQEDGLWSLVCAATPNCGTRPESKETTI